MRILRVLDSKDYDESLPLVTRSAVRAIIRIGGKLALIRSDKFGEFKFPGGGALPGETHPDTIIREVREETGLSVKPSSIREYGMTRERRRDISGEGVFEQSSYYYLCDIEGAASETSLDKYEKEYGYKLTIVSVDDAISANAKLITSEGPPWIERELFMLRHLSAFLKQQGNSTEEAANVTAT